MIWLIGNRGMLGTELEILLREKSFPYVGSDRELDITNLEELIPFASGKGITWIVNCSAYTAVDKAEDEVDLAFGINSRGVLNISHIAKQIQAKVIHISTDYVFDGMKDGPYLENDIPAPLGVYGRSKLEGEFHLKQNLERYYIIRTAWLYGLNGSNFVNTMLRLLNTKDKLEIVADQWGSPTYAKDLAEVLIKVIEQDSGAYGTYHFTNEGFTNWYEFTKTIYEKGKGHNLVSTDVLLNPITTEQYPTKARRPKNSVLSKDKIKQIFDLKIDNWENALERYLIERKRRIAND